MTILEAIARMEGFYVIGSRPQRNNNPGDIEYGRFSVAHGATGSDGRFAVFPSPDAGFRAMAALLSAPAYAGLTVGQALDKWAPPIENNTNAYTAFVCKAVGCTPDTPLAGLLNASL
jgi:hypothetical protein